MVGAAGADRLATVTLWAAVDAGAAGAAEAEGVGDAGVTRCAVAIWAR